MPMPGTPSYNFEISKAKYLLGGNHFQGFSYITDDPEFSTTIPIEDLKKIGDEFESLARVNRNLNLFKYSEFTAHMVKFLILHPLFILEALLLRYLLHRTHQRSLLGVVKDAVQFHRQRF